MQNLLKGETPWLRTGSVRHGCPGAYPRRGRSPHTDRESAGGFVTAWNGSTGAPAGRELEADGQRFAVPLDVDADRLRVGVRVEHPLDVGPRENGLAAEADDSIPFLQPGLFGGA